MFRNYWPSLRLVVPWRVLIAAGAVLLCAVTSRADTPSVTAVLSSANTVVGQPVQLQIKISGSSGAKPPRDIFVDGLEIRYTGQSQLWEGRNFQFTYSFICNYTVMPLKPGTFKIPPQMVEAGGSALRTPELTLRVADSGNAPAPRSSNRSNSQIDPSKIAFAELMLSKTTAYVGEMIPAVLRIAVNIRTPVESYPAADITGQGFTAQRMGEQRTTIETIDGKTYQVFTFKTALSPARAGKIEVGPVQVHTVVRMPRNPQRNPSMPRDLFDPNDPFMDNFFSDPFFAPSVPQEITFKSEGVTLDVKPLPSGAPADFGGAIGNFSLASDVKPKTAQVGDPLTITATITGRGNFDRVTAPAFEDEKGWHKYPPSSDFKKDDEVGISGTKTFETVLSANERKDKIPAQIFSYFDPGKEQYVTLRAEPIAVRVEGGSTAVVPTPAPTTAQAPTNGPAQAPRPATQQGILHQLPSMSAEPESFTPFYARRPFWLAQLIPLLALVGFILWKVRQARANDREAQRREALQHEAAALQRSLRREDVSPEEYFSRASRAVQLKTALARNLDPNAVDADIAANAFRMDEESRIRLRRLFEKSDEARYSGGGNGGPVLPTETRNQVLELIDNLKP
jgi:hypothetical protein